MQEEHGHHHVHLPPRGSFFTYDETGPKKKRRRIPRIGLIFALMFPSSLSEMVDEIEWDALFSQFMTSAHVIYGISLNPIDWPPIVYYVMEWVNWISFALDRYP